MKAIHTTQIHNHLQLPNVEQHVNINRFNIDGYQETIEIYYDVKYFKDGQALDLQRAPQPWNISNSDQMMIRDQDFNPVPNPDYAVDENGVANGPEFLTKPAFDYVLELMLVLKVDLDTIMTMYVLEEAQDGRFD